MESTLKILLLEDMQEDVELIGHTLKKAGLKFETLQVDDRSAFEKALKEFVPDIVLSDHSLPQFNSIEALELFRKSGLCAPFIQEHSVILTLPVAAVDAAQTLD